MRVPARMLREAAINGLREGFINYLDAKLAEKTGKTYCISEFEVKLYAHGEDSFAKYLDLEILHMPTGFKLFSECPTPINHIIPGANEIITISAWMKDQINRMIKILDETIIEAEFRDKND